MTSKQTFITMITMLSATFRQELDKPSLDGYWLALEDLTEDELKAVCKRALRESKFMPSPAELLAFAGKSGAKVMESRIAEAWDAVRGAMDKHDYTTSVDFGPLVNAAVRSCGGWVDLCGKSIPDLVWVRKEFAKLYEAFAEKDPATLKGQPLRGAFPGTAARVPIGGITPPLALPGARSETSSMVRDLADGKLP